MNVNGLRVYTNLDMAETVGGYDIFYSRRADGPYYRWTYEEKLGRWDVARVKACDFSARTFSAASWKGIPASLQRSMVEHYED